MDPIVQIDNEFSRLASLPDKQIDLARGALLIAKTAYPDLNESFYLERLNRLAAKVINNGKVIDNTVDVIPMINRILFDEEKLRGNSENYYDPDNSFLNRVLDRKLGIPITLSLIYIEVAGRLDFDLRGIGLPGHFITAMYHGASRVFIDPFHRGEIRTVNDCREIIRQHVGEAVASDPRWLEPIGKKEFLARMLRNLKLIYAKRDDDIMLFRLIHWILALQPEAPVELRERAMLYEAMGNPARAIKDWEKYIVGVSDIESKQEIQARIDFLEKQKPRIH